MKFLAAVLIECETLDQAEQVITERVGFDEDLGFDYTIRQLGETEELPA